MKTRLLSPVLAAALALSAGAASAADYAVDTTHSFVTFKVSHLGVSYVLGGFDVTSGTITFDPEGTPADQKVTVEVDLTSLDSNHAERDKHLRSSDFLNTDVNSSASFTSTSFEGDATGGVLKGDLTFFGTTKPIEVSVTKVGEGKDPWGGYRAGFEGTAKLTPADFGMNYNLGPAAATVDLNIVLEGVQQ
ncbi:YceI family protein [Rhodalgimonas zhirmunskyi]|uniref:YceI family protein n=1 Tax=Rhodalgimonas zhirmunskyi TaxID=2964767 RepID=A0AAJ1X7X1_9RHOB|nr:YceI family protein [Rhodoalgimonas zhirmunskyi]MDQ2095002.1 YceI family protein [Rhodoalgimonas zhirmunskyi]